MILPQYYQGQNRPTLDVVVLNCRATLRNKIVVKDKPLLASRNIRHLFNQSLEGLNLVARLHIQRYGLTRRLLREDLHS